MAAGRPRTDDRPVTARDAAAPGSPRDRIRCRTRLGQACRPVEQPAEHEQARADRHGRAHDRDLGHDQRLAQRGHEADHAEGDEGAGRDGVAAAPEEPEPGPDEQRDRDDEDLERELVVGAEQPDHDVLGAGWLEIDDDLADRRDERRGARQQPGQQLGDAERGRGRDDPGDGRRPIKTGLARGHPGGWGRVRRAAHGCIMGVRCDIRVSRLSGSPRRSASMRAQARPARRSMTIGRPNARLKTSARRTSSSAPGRDDLPVAQHERVREPGWDLLDMVGDEHDGRRSWLAGEDGQVVDETLAGAQVEARRRLVEEQQVRVGHQRPGDRRAPALAGRQRRVVVIGHLSDPQPLEQVAGARPVVLVVDVPPRLGGGMAGRHHQRDRGQVATQRALDRCARRADPLAELARVDGAVARPENRHRAGRRPQLEADHRQEGGLARTVRAEHDPALTGPDRPVERTEDRPSGTPNLEAANRDDRVGVGHRIRTARRSGVALA